MKKNVLYRVVVLLSLCALPACASRAPLPAWQGEEMHAHFTARVKPQAADLPLQGGVRIHPGGGVMGLISQHGRTLGQCAYVLQGDAFVLQCTPAPGMTATQALLPRVARGVYTILLQQGAPHVGKDKTLQVQRYEDTFGEVEILFTEIRRP